jgi:hypothetical protein
LHFVFYFNTGSVSAGSILTFRVKNVRNSKSTKPVYILDFATYNYYGTLYNVYGPITITNTIPSTIATKSLV